MKKVWTMPEMAEMSIKQTASGATPSENHDGDWEQRPDGSWWRPGGNSGEPIVG